MQQLRSPQVAPGACTVEGRLALQVLLVNVGTLIQKELHHLLATFAPSGSSVKRGITILVLMVEDCTMSQ